MKQIIFILLLLFPICVFAQTNKVTLSKEKQSKAMKPWMKRYLSPSYNSLTVNLPFRKTKPVVTKYSYARLEKRNQLEGEKLSPYLEKVYIQRQHARIDNIYSTQSMNFQNTYDPGAELINRVFRVIATIK